MNKISEYFKNRREFLGLSQFRLAFISSVSIYKIQMLEKGKAENLTIPEFCCLAIALNENPADLLDFLGRAIFGDATWKTAIKKVQL